MNRNFATRARTAGAMSAILALGVAGCASEPASEGDATGADVNVSGAKNNGNAQTIKGLTGTLNGGGASSQQDAQRGWSAGFTESNPDVTVNYAAVGSGTGRDQFLAGRNVFGGTDEPWEGDELAKAEKNICKGSPLIEVPSYVAPIAVAYNLPGVEDLKLSPEVLAGIFAGEITQWSDPAIASLNKGAELPDLKITAVHRSDESGTTGNFTDYLSQVAPQDWDAGATEIWPKAYGGEAAEGTSGVVGVVTDNEGAITYADAAQAGDLGHAQIQVGSTFQGPTPEAAAKGLEVSKTEGNDPNKLIYAIDRKTTEKGAYPVILVSYAYTCQKWSNKADAELAKAYMEYMVSPDGQKRAAEAAGAAPLSESVRADAEKIISQVSQG